jgi:hypothetical protein
MARSLASLPEHAPCRKAGSTFAKKTPAAEEGGRLNTSLYRLVLAATGGERLRFNR